MAWSIDAHAAAAEVFEVLQETLGEHLDSGGASAEEAVQADAAIRALTPLVKAGHGGAEVAITISGSIESGSEQITLVVRASPPPSSDQRPRPAPG